MSDSEGTKELSGIARSVEALFSSVAVPDDSFPEPGSEAPPPLPEDARAPDQDEGPGEVELSMGAEEPGEAALAMDEEGPGEAALSVDDVEPGEVALSVDETPDGEDLSTEEDPPSGADLSPVDRPVPEDVSSADDEAVSPLAAAVEAYLDGDSAKASEVEALAGEMLERRRLDDVAAAVGRLAGRSDDSPAPEAVELAKALATPLVYEHLVRRMGAERDDEKRKEYYAACRSLGAPMAAALRDGLAEADDRLARRVYCEALVDMGDVGRTVIEEMAVDDNKFLARNAVAILGRTGGEGAVELVTAALGDTDPRVRREALRSLAKLGDEESGELIIGLGLLQDPDPDVRIAAAVAAGELRVERALRSVIKLLDDTSDPDEAIPLIRALGALGDPGAVASIEKHVVPKLFSKPRTDVRIAGYRALNQIGTPHARRLLNQAMEDKDPEVKAAVKDMLGMR